MSDRLFKGLLFVAGFSLFILAAGIVYALCSESIPALCEIGLWNFLSGTEWNSIKGEYGALPFIVGTLITSILALLFCLPFALSVALFNGEYFRRTKFAMIISAIVDLLAGVPSIVYGLWGFYTIRPAIIALGVNAQGFGILTASIVLAIMIIPYVSSLSGEFISMVPSELKEGAYSLGATRIEMLMNVSLPAAASGIFASIILALGRALGETMAVTMLIGNTTNIPLRLSDTGNSMASIIANQFGEAEGLKLSALFTIGLLLFIITAIINLIAKQVIARLKR